MNGLEFVVVGGSWGGLDAACRVLDKLPAPLPVPVVLVLHRAKTSDARVLREAVRRCSGQDLVEVEDQVPPTPGAVHLAPPDYHLLVERDRFSLSTDSMVNFSRPSIDVTLESAAEAYGSGLAAVLLTGSGRDGADGLRRVGELGGRTLVQAPETAERGEMPDAALQAWQVDDVGSPEQLGHRLVELLGGSAPIEGA